MTARRAVSLARNCSSARVLEIAHAAPEVELPPDDARADGVDRHGVRAPRPAQALGDSQPQLSRVRVEGRELVGAPDLVEGARLLNTQDCHAQVAVLLQRLGDHRLQLRVGEVVAPRNLRGGGRIGLRDRRHRRIGGILVRDRQRRPGKFGRERAPRCQHSEARCAHHRERPQRTALVPRSTRSARSPQSRYRQRHTERRLKVK